MEELKKLIKQAFTVGFGKGWLVGYAAGVINEQPPTEAIAKLCKDEC